MGIMYYVVVVFDRFWGEVFEKFLCEFKYICEFVY